MAIRTVVTRGFGNGTFNGTIALVVTRGYTLGVAVPEITTGSLLNGTVGVAYSDTVTATSGTEPFTWSVSAGSLPAGLSLAAATGVISGTPTTAGDSTFTILVTDDNSQTDSKEFTITIVAVSAEVVVEGPAGGGGGSAGAEIAPIRFASVELQYEPVIVSLWAFVPSLIVSNAPAIAVFEAHVLPLGKAIPLHAGTFIAKTGARGGVLHKELAEHRHQRELDALRQRVQDMEDMRFLGLL